MTSVFKSKQYFKSDAQYWEYPTFCHLYESKGLIRNMMKSEFKKRTPNSLLQILYLEVISASGLQSSSVSSMSGQSQAVYLYIVMSNYLPIHNTNSSVYKLMVGYIIPSFSCLNAKYFVCEVYSLSTVSSVRQTSPEVSSCCTTTSVQSSFDKHLSEMPLSTEQSGRLVDQLDWISFRCEIYMLNRMWSRGQDNDLDLSHCSASGKINQSKRKQTCNNNKSKKQKIRLLQSHFCHEIQNLHC